MTEATTPPTLLPESQPIAKLVTVDSSLLYVFLVGPGEGEAIAIALPNGRGWLLLDGCRAGDGSIGLVEVLRKWRTKDAPIVAYAMTHPHTDHAKGVVELVEEFGSAIRYVAVTPPWTAPAQSRIESDRINKAQVRKSLAALERLCAGGAIKVDLVAGAEISLPDTSPVAIRVLCPAAGASATTDPNEVSAVVDLLFGKTRVVLGSDLPLTTAGGGGWNALVVAAPEVADHAMLKIPHHGSSTAHSPVLYASHVRERAWGATPYNSSRLPELVRMDGLPWILGRGHPVHLTAPPVSKAVQVPVTHPALLTLATLRERVAVQPTGIPLLDRGAVESKPTAIRSRDSLWCFALDDGGRVAGRWRGDAAIEVIS